MLVPPTKYLFGNPLTMVGLVITMVILGRVAFHLFRRRRPDNVQDWIFSSSLLLTLTMLIYRLTQ